MKHLNISSVVGTSARAPRRGVPGGSDRRFSAVVGCFCLILTGLSGLGPRDKTPRQDAETRRRERRRVSVDNMLYGVRFPRLRGLSHNRGTNRGGLGNRVEFRVYFGQRHITRRPARPGRGLGMTTKFADNLGQSSGRLHSGRGRGVAVADHVAQCAPD